LKLWPFGRKSQGDTLSIDQVIRRLEAIYAVSSGVTVTPETCEDSPTVKAIITAVTRRFAAMPVHVFQKGNSGGRASMEVLPNHPVEKLLNRPNGWQTNVNYWMDATSRFLRYGNFYAFKSRGSTGPIRSLVPLSPSTVDVYQDPDNFFLTYKVSGQRGGFREFPQDQVHHVRSASRDSIKGDCPVMDVRESIGLEIAAERFGATFFGNGAMPGIVFKYSEGSQGFESEDQRRAFIETFRESFNNRGRFKAILPPRGLEVANPIPVDNDKAQFIELRQIQRTIIAGAFGVPPHLVGDLTKGTFNNVEMQGIEFSTNCILPVCRAFEAAMERDLLTDSDRTSGVVIRFNPDAILRADFKSQQEGLQIQRQNGIINANEWREMENMNPISVQDGGDEYWRQGPSGQTAAPNGGGNNDTQA